MKYFVRINGLAEQLKDKATYDQINEIRSHMPLEMKNKFMTWMKTVPSTFCTCGGEVIITKSLHTCKICGQTQLV